jgi:predicted MPP superfamily phosphohydrolase
MRVRSMVLRRFAVAALVAATVALTSAQGALPLPNRPDSLKFAAFGDMGTGERPQYEVAAQMVTAHQRFPFDFVIMLGDNMYGGQSPQDFVKKFEQPYKPLLDAGVKFYASLGNHDNQSNRFYKYYNMDGQRFYTYVKKDVRFFALDTDFLDQPQRTWIENALKSATEPWKICYFHHPLYSDGKTHGSAVDLRVILEPLFIKYGVNVVFSGHDHIYERIKPQKGIYYFVSGSGGQLRKGDTNRSEMNAFSYDQDQTFMLVEIANDDLSFATITRTGSVVDSGVLHRQQAAATTP